MQRVLSIIEEVSSIASVKNATFVEKGFSPDEKWVLEAEDGSQIFVKICEEKVADHKENEFQYMRSFYDRGVPVPEPKQFQYLPQYKKCVQVFEYVLGEDAEVTLPHLSDSAQYEAGVQAGKVLRDIHSLHKQDPTETWEEYRWSKYKRYSEALEEMEEDIPHTFRMEPVESFIQEHKHLLKDRPVVFMHDDYHPSNLMMEGTSFKAVIDFDRYEWGDPYHDYYKLALFTRNISVPFSIGQLHGYFEGEPPMHFWQLYALYVAMAFNADIVWAMRMGEGQPELSHQRLQQMYDDHKGFTRYIPTWYEKSF